MRLRSLLSFLVALLPAFAGPPRLSYSTYLGGSGSELVDTITTDSAGNYYVAAHTNSPNYPRLPVGQSFSGDLDIVVSKFSPANALLYSTVIGGSGSDTPGNAAVDSDGNLYLTFSTTSTNFPRPSGSVIGGSAAGTGVLKLSPSGTLTAVALFACPPPAFASGLTLDANGNVWICGGTTGFAGQTGAIQRDVAGGGDIFVARFNSALTQIGYFTYLGTAAEENASRIGLDAAGNVYLLGNGGSASFPTGGGKAFPGAGSFAVKLDTVNNKVLFATYLTAGTGGSGLVVDGADVWVAANSSGTGFTPTPDAAQTVYAGGFNDMILARLNASDGQIRYATYFGGNGGDFANGLALDPAGNLIIFGNTSSTNFPVTPDALRKTASAQTTGFIAVIDGGGRLLYSSYLGGSGTFDFGLAIAVDAAGNAIVGGGTTSADFPVTAGAFQTQRGSGGDVPDGYVTRVEFVAAADPNLTRAAVQNAASFRGGAIAPGEVVVIYPSNAGPANLVTAALTADRKISTLIGATRVLFDGTPAPMVYTVKGQASFTVPYALAGKSFTRVVVEYNGVSSRPMAFPVTAAAPGIFTIASGTGPAALFNENGSPNSAQNPADRGSIIVFFASGEGQTSPAGVDGRLNEFARLEDYPRPLQTVKVTVGGLPAEILYAGGAPSFLAGLMQFNVRMSPGVQPGPSVLLEVTIGTNTSQPAVTLAVK